MAAYGKPKSGNDSTTDVLNNILGSLNIFSPQHAANAKKAGRTTGPKDSAPVRAVVQTNMQPPVIKNLPKKGTTKKTTAAPVSTAKKNPSIVDLINQVNAGRKKLLSDWQSQVPELKTQSVSGLQNFYTQYLGDYAEQGIGQEQAALALLKSAAQGEQPSAAEAQLQMGLNKSLQSQMAAAKSGRGGYNPLAIRQAQQLGQQAMLETNLQKAGLRAEEMATARGQYSEAAGRLSNSINSLNQTRMNTQSMIAKTMTDYDNMTANLYGNAMGVSSDVTKQQEQIASNERISKAANDLQIKLKQMGIDYENDTYWRNFFANLVGGAGSEFLSNKIKGA